MHTVFTVQPPHPHPINKHSGPKDTIYVNHSGASIKQQVSSWTPWMEGGSSGFPDNMTWPGEAEVYFYVQREAINLSNSSDSSDPWFKMVTDFHDLNIRHTKHRMRMLTIPPFGRDDSERVVFSDRSTAYHDPLVLPKWSNHISASLSHVPLQKKKKRQKEKKRKTHIHSCCHWNWWVSYGADTSCRSQMGCRKTCTSGLHTGGITAYSNMMLVSLMLAWRRQSIIMKTQKLAFYTLITLWMLCTIVLNLRPAFVMLDLIYINV